MKSKSRSRPQTELPDAPVVITSLHVKDRSYSSEVADGARSKRVLSQNKAWRKLTPLEAMHVSGKLAGGNSVHDAAARFAAGKRYAGIFDCAQTSGRDSSQMQTISRSTGGAGIGQNQSEALRALARIEAKLGARDARIVRMVCGEGYAAVEAVRAACGDDYKHTVAARFREALDALVEGFKR